MTRPKPIALDLFCGAGGLSLGFEQAGFNVIGAIDQEDRHVETYRRNFPWTKSVSADLSKASGASLLKQVGGLPVGRELDVIFGGPPCQGFSTGGKHNADDERNSLVYHFARILRELRPRYFVMENVAGMLHRNVQHIAKSFKHRVRCAGYTVLEERVLDASDFGVPQRRRRVFFIGHLTGEPPPTYPPTQGFTDIEGNEYFPTVSDAIADLPEVDSFEHLFHCETLKIPLGPPTHYARLMRGELRDLADKGRPRKPSKVLTGCLRTRHSAETRARFKRTLPGEREPVSRFFRLHPDEIAPTLRAGTDHTRGSHTAPRPIHPTQPRCITVREAARLHSFPDWFVFHPTRWHALRQIGNSVPPRLAWAVAKEVYSVATATQMQRARATQA